MCLIFAFIFTVFNSISPELTRDEYFVFHSENNFYIVDSEHIHATKNGTSYKKWKHNIDWEHFDFLPVQNKNKTFILSKGGGVVYEFHNDSIRRVDRSFEHKNKYGSFNFTYNNQIFSFGGYGLFIQNNSLSFFSETNQEWFEFFLPSDLPKPSPRQAPIGQLIDSTLYLGGGFFKSIDNQLEEQLLLLQDFWRLDLSSRQWSYLGKRDLSKWIEYNQHITTHDIFYRNQHLVFNRTSVIGFDFGKNLITEYKNPSALFKDKISTIHYNPNTDLFLVSKLHHDGKLKDRIILIAPEDLLGTEVDTHPFIEDSTNDLMYMGVALLLIISFVVYYYYNLRSKSTHRILKKNIQKIEEQLSSNECVILHMILENHPKPVDYPSILDVYGYSLTYESRIKKMRLSLKKIDEVISKYTPTKKTTLSYGKNKNDKRIKEVCIK